MEQEMVSVVLPCFNEERYIKTVVRNIFGQDYPSDKIEIFIVDGNSTDRTIEIVKELIQADSRIKLLDNPQKIVPYALNKAIAASSGKYIIRFDAHTEYANDYISKV